MLDLSSLTISQMASLNRISTQALRLYSNKGLIQPVTVDNQTKYRYYDIRQSCNIDFIVYLKSIGMTLSEIKTYFENGSASYVFSQLNTCLLKVEQEQQRLNTVKASIQRLLNRMQMLEHSPAMNTILIEKLPARVIHTYKIKSDFHIDGHKNYERLLRNMKNFLSKKKVPLNYFTNVGYIIPQDNFMEKDFIATSLFIYGDEYSQSLLDSTDIEENNFLCCYFKEYQQEITFREKIFSELKRKNYKVIGDYICEPIIEFPVFNNIIRSSIIRIQIPITTNANSDNK
ncbi:TPA: MerR family transcriptional regulator [Salmonella enterica]|nr:MerR family transcriptional regulator [Salmonella enterica]